jgi:hypothetical protein
MQEVTFNDLAPDTTYFAQVVRAQHQSFLSLPTPGLSPHQAEIAGADDTATPAVKASAGPDTLERRQQPTPPCTPSTQHGV